MIDLFEIDVNNLEQSRYKRFVSKVIDNSKFQEKIEKADKDFQETVNKYIAPKQKKVNLFYYLSMISIFLTLIFVLLFVQELDKEQFPTLQLVLLIVSVIATVVTSILQYRFKKALDKAMKSDEVKEWKNIVDIRYEYPSLVKGLDKDGNYFSTIETEEKFVLNKIHYIGNSVIDGGTIYSVNDDNSVIIQKENVVFDIYVPSKQYSSNSDIYYILYDGKIVNQNDDVIAEAQDYSYIYSKDFLSYQIQGEFYMIGNDGKVEKVFHRYYEDMTWFKMLVEKLQTDTVKV